MCHVVIFLLLLAHHFGVYGPEYDNALVSADRFAKLIMEGLTDRNLVDCVNVLFISDHGVADYNTVINTTVIMEKFPAYNDNWKKNNIFEVWYTIRRFDWLLDVFIVD